MSWHVRGRGRGALPLVAYCGSVHARGQWCGVERQARLCLPSPYCVAAGGPRLAPGCAAPEAFDAACVLDAPIAVAGYMLRWRWPAMQPICSEKTEPASYILIVNLRLV
jgi:hypothetical protein